jgi:hypothetical protein
MLIHKRMRRIANEQLRHNQQTDLLLLAVKRLLQDVAPVAVCREVDDAAAARQI